MTGTHEKPLLMKPLVRGLVKLTLKTPRNQPDCNSRYRPSVRAQKINFFCVDVWDRVHRPVPLTIPSCPCVSNYRVIKDILITRFPFNTHDVN